MPRPARLLGLLALLATGGAAGGAAQPAPDALVAAWAEGQSAAARDVGAVVLAERVEREVDGPRGRMRVGHDGTVRYAPGARPERAVDGVTVDGRALPADRGGAARRRLGRAFGPAGRVVAAPPPPALEALTGARPHGPTEADRVGAEAAWRVVLRAGPDARPRHVEAWFSRSAAGRLLRTRTESRHRGGRVVREVDYARAAGLDVPRDVRTVATVRQRRRLRDYVVTVRSEGRYRLLAVERAGR